MINFAQFLSLLLLEVITHRWCSSAITATLIVLVSYSIKEIKAFSNENQISFWLIMFLLIFSRTLIKDLIKGKSYIERNLLNLSLEDFISHPTNKITIKSKDYTNPYKLYLLYYSAKEMRTSPSIWLDSFQMKKKEIVLDNFRVVNLDNKKSGSFVEIELSLKELRPSKNLKIEDIKSFSIVLDASPFDKNSIYHKILYFAGYTVKNIKKLKFLF